MQFMKYGYVVGMNEITDKEITAAHIADIIGRQRLSLNLNVGLTAISNACVAGRFPAAWYNKMRVLCGERDIECPVELFNWR